MVLTNLQNHTFPIRLSHRLRFRLGLRWVIRHTLSLRMNDRYPNPQMMCDSLKIQPRITEERARSRAPATEKSALNAI